MKLLILILSLLLLTTPANSISLKPIKERQKDFAKLLEDIGATGEEINDLNPARLPDHSDEALIVRIINFIILEIAEKKSMKVSDIYTYARRKRPNVSRELVDKAINDTGYHRRGNTLYNFPDPFGARLSFKLKHGDILAGTDLLERFQNSSKNGVHIIYISGFFETAGYSFSNIVRNVDPNDIIIYYWDLFDSNEDVYHFGLAVDRKIHFMRSIAYNPENFMNMRIGSRALLIRMKEIPASKEVILQHISIGKNEEFDHAMSYRTLRGRGYMEQIFFSLEIFLKTRYDGWDLQTRPINKKVNEFLSTFQATPQGKWHINGGRLTRDQYLTLAEIIIEYGKERLKLEQFRIDSVYRDFIGVNPNFIDIVIDSAFALEDDIIVGLRSLPDNIGDIIDSYMRSSSYAQKSA